MAHPFHQISTILAVCTSVASLFTGILRHGYMPEAIIILHSFPKVTKIHAAKYGNYRPIALSPILSKAHEWCLLISYPGSFSTSGLQFGFKPKMSTAVCMGSVKNVVSHYMHKGSSIFFNAFWMPQKHMIWYHDIQLVEKMIS